MPTTLRTLAALTAALALLAIATAHRTVEAGRPEFVVNSTVDEVDADIGDNLCAAASGDCTLRAALQETNLLGGPDTIIVPAGTYELTIAVPNGGGGPVDTDANSDLDIKDGVTIVGAGSDLTIIDGVNDYRGFDISQTFASTVNISGLAVVNGNAGNQNGGGFQLRGIDVTVNLTDIAITDSVGQYGGGIYVETNTNLYIERSRINNNEAISDGGGIDINTSGLVSVTDSFLRMNTADSAAGIMNTDSSSGTLVVERTEISDNVAATFGGGIFNGAEASITESTISENKAMASGGGGIYNASSEPLTVTATTIDHNHAGGQNEGGGGIEQDSDGEINIVRSTITGNNSSTVGGAILIQDFGGVFIIDSTIAGNTGDGGIYFRAEGPVQLLNSIIADNGAKNCKREAGVGNSLNSDGPNVSDDSTCNVPDLIIGNPELSPLTDNGGPTQTMAIGPTSDAIDAADESHCTVDQRGAPPFDGDGDSDAVCDIGAFEFGYFGRTWGDFNCDGEITPAGDALPMLLARIDLAGAPAAPCPAPNTPLSNAPNWGDFGCSGIFDEEDILPVLSYLAGTLDNTPGPSCPALGTTVLVTVPTT